MDADFDFRGTPPPRFDTNTFTTHVDLDADGDPPPIYRTAAEETLLRSRPRRPPSIHDLSNEESAPLPPRIGGRSRLQSSESWPLNSSLPSGILGLATREGAAGGLPPDYDSVVHSSGHRVGRIRLGFGYQRNRIRGFSPDEHIVVVDYKRKLVFKALREDVKRSPNKYAKASMQGRSCDVHAKFWVTGPGEIEVYLNLRIMGCAVVWARTFGRIERIYLLKSSVLE